MQQPILSITHNLTPDNWDWDCDCGSTGRGYATENDAKDSGERHQLRMHAEVFGQSRSARGQIAWVEQMHRQWHMGIDCASAYPQRARYGPVTIEQECPFPGIARFIWTAQHA